MRLEQVVYRCADCEIDCANRRFTRGGKEYSLEPKVFAVLVQLLTRSGELLTREQLLDTVWGHRYVTPSTLNRVITSPDAHSPATPTAQSSFKPSTARLPIHRPHRKDRSRLHGGARALRAASIGAPAGAPADIARARARITPDRRPAPRRSIAAILGTGGMGKTQCALAFAHEQVDRFRDSVWFST